MWLIVERKFFEDIRVKAVGIENVLILDCKRDDAAAYLVLRNFEAKHLLVRESQLGNDQHIAVVLLESFCKVQ